MTVPVVVDFTHGQDPGQASLATTTHDVDLPSGAAGDLLLANFGYEELVSGNDLTWPGWTRLGRSIVGTVDGYCDVWYRIADGSEGLTDTITSASNCHLTYQIRRISGHTGDPVIGSFDTNAGGSGATSCDPPALSPGFDPGDVLWVAIMAYGHGDRTVTGFPAGYSDPVSETPGDNAQFGVASATRTTDDDTEDPGPFTTSSLSWQSAVTVAVPGAEGDPPVDPTEPPPYVPPAPGGALIEIRAAAPGSSRWGSARWGTGSPTSGRWSPAGWQDVTPQSISGTIRWGSRRPERGVLAETEAGTWLIETFDPERRLDPGNLASPYAADLRAGLPVRVSHRGVIIRKGFAESIVYFDNGTKGGMRVTDAVSIMARVQVPADTDLADTLRARARDVIAAAALSIEVEPDPPTGDPALAPRLDGVRSVWRHVADAAEQVLHIPFVDRNGVLRFRAWASPLERGRGVDQTELMDLGREVSTAGLYSVVQARDADTDDIVERRLTPTPRYGPVTYTRDDPTPDAGAWADAVLADRSLQTVQWIPGRIRPLDANAVEYFATLEAVERFGASNDATDPAVDIVGIIVGGTITLAAKRGDSARWYFDLELAQTARAPLYTDTDPPEFLLTESGDGYLYGD